MQQCKGKWKLLHWLGFCDYGCYTLTIPVTAAVSVAVIFMVLVAVRLGNRVSLGIEQTNAMGACSADTCVNMCIPSLHACIRIFKHVSALNAAYLRWCVHPLTCPSRAKFRSFLLNTWT